MDIQDFRIIALYDYVISRIWSWIAPKFGSNSALSILLMSSTRIVMSGLNREDFTTRRQVAYRLRNAKEFQRQRNRTFIVELGFLIN